MLENEKKKTRKLRGHIPHTGLEKLSEEQKNEVVDLLSQGNSMQAASKKTGISLHYVKLIKHTYHLPNATRRQKDRNQQIVDMREKEGMTYEAIAKKLGGNITRQRVYYIYHRDTGTLPEHHEDV